MSAVAEGFVVDAAQLRRHAQRLEELGDRFDAVKSASGYIARNDEAYGFLCGWIAAVLEERHARQNELIAHAQANLTLAARALRTAAGRYDGSDEESAKTLSALARRPMPHL